MNAAAARPRASFVTLGLLVFSLAFYVYTLTPSLGWEDAPKFSRHAYLLKLSALPWDHPFYTLVGHLFTYIPLRDVAYRVNLVSTVFGALAVAVVFNLVRLLFTAGAPSSGLAETFAALGAALSLMVSRTFWHHAVTTEVYVVLSFFTVAVVYCLVRFDLRGERRFLLLGFALYGLSVAVHVQTVCAVPGLVVYLVLLVAKHKPSRGLRLVGLAGLAFFAGFSLYLGFAVYDFFYLTDKFHSSFSDVVNVLVAGPYKNNFLNPPYPLGYAPLQAIGYHAYDFLVVGALLGVFGIFRFMIRDRRRFGYIFTVYAGFLGFATFYFVADQNTFYLPALTLFSVFVGYGLLGLLRALKTAWRTVVVAVPLLGLLWAGPVVVYGSLPQYIAGLPSAQRTTYEQWVVFNYGRRADWELRPIWMAQGKDLLVKHYLNPNKRDDVLPRRYAERLLDGLPPDAVLIAGNLLDWYSFAVIDYLQAVEHRRPDVTFVHWEYPWEQAFSEMALRKALAGNVGSRPVFVSFQFRYTIGTALPSYRFAPRGLVYQVIR